MSNIKTITAPDRLGLLLPWLNGRYEEPHFAGTNPVPVAVWTDYPAVRRALGAFVRSFDGSADAAFVVAEPTDDVAALTDNAIGDLEALLRILLEQGFGDNADLSFPVASLRFALRGANRRKPGRRGSIVDGGVTAVRRYQASGAYVLRVQGPLTELVPFLLAQLLTAPNMVTVNRCERRDCQHYLITATGRRGRPQRFCGAWCREWTREQQKTKRTRRRTS